MKSTCNTPYIKVSPKHLLSVTFLLFVISGFAQLGWVQVPSPNPSVSRNMIRGISGTSSSDVWAVGSYEEQFNFNPYYVENDLLLHWNGTAWQQFPALHLSISLDDLWDVEAIAANNVWAVGNYNDFATTRAELLHYNGTGWTNQSLPYITGGSYLYAIHALSATDIWAAGGQSGSPTRPCYVIHYNGSSWSEIPVPTVGIYRNTFNDIHGLSSNDIWAVGHRGEHYGDFHTLAMHWNGSNWTNIALPSSITSQLSELLTVKMIASNDVWATGYYITGGGFHIHWDGILWTEITPMNGGGGAYAPLASNNLFSVGGDISHWNGTAWSMVDSLTQLSYPSLGSSVVFSNGDIWAGGRTVDANNNFFSLVYRTVNNIPVFTGGSSQTWNIALNSVNNTPDNLLLVSDADVSQILTYSIVTSPLHGNLSGLPASAITSNGSAMPTGIYYTPAAGYSGTDYFVIRVAAGTVSSETAITVNVFAAVPLTLIDFNVNREGTNALLKWTTASESNTKRFEVEHSTDGIYFISAGDVVARGNSNTIASYRYIHGSPAPGQNYYRLKLVDLNGRITFFPVRSVHFDMGILPPITLLANPVINGKINLQFNITGKNNLNIYNLKGQKIFTKSINNGITGSHYLVTLPDVEPGIYILELNNDQQTHTIKLLIQ